MTKNQSSKEFENQALTKRADKSVGTIVTAIPVGLVALIPAAGDSICLMPDSSHPHAAVGRFRKQLSWLEAMHQIHQQAADGGQIVFNDSRLQIN